MNVEQAIAIAKEWVDLHGSQAPGFCGAHLMGGILAMPKGVPFPAYKDVDIMLVLKDLPGEEEGDTQEVSYKELILECGSMSIEKYRSPEAALINPELACNLAVDSILSDPGGLLQSLQSVVAREYAKRTWVQARCAYEKNLVKESLEELSQTSSTGEAVFQLQSIVLYLAGLLAVAHLVAPTYRRSFILLRTLLQEHGRLDLHEEALSLVGFGHFTRQQAESYLQDCALAFDKALEVKRSPFPFEYKYHAHIKPYIIEGSQEMINEGYYREAMFWITGFLMFSNFAIQINAPEAEKQLFQAKLDHLIQDMGITTLAEVQFRCQRARELAERIFAVADEYVEHLPG